eukprot:2205789-Rhodomonas_salina.2
MNNDSAAKIVDPLAASVPLASVVSTGCRRRRIGGVCTSRAYSCRSIHETGTISMRGSSTILVTTSSSPYVESAPGIA